MRRNDTYSNHSLESTKITGESSKNTTDVTRNYSRFVEFPPSNTITPDTWNAQKMKEYQGASNAYGDNFRPTQDSSNRKRYEFPPSNTITPDTWNAQKMKEYQGASNAYGDNSDHEHHDTPNNLANSEIENRQKTQAASDNASIPRNDKRAANGIRVRLESPTPDSSRKYIQHPDETDYKFAARVNKTRTEAGRNPHKEQTHLEGLHIGVARNTSAFSVKGFTNTTHQYDKE